MQLVAGLHAEKMYHVPNSLRVISDRWASCCQRLRQEGCERKAVAASKKTVAFFLSLQQQQQQQHHPPPAAATSGGPPCPTLPPLLFGGCKDGENRFFLLFFCVLVCFHVDCTVERTFSVRSLFSLRKCCSGNFMRLLLMMKWSLLTIEWTILHLKKCKCTVQQFNTWNDGKAVWL